MRVINKFVGTSPTVSIVIPSYNRAELIYQTIDSIINQQCNFAFEIIIGDDSSTDNVKEILIEYQKKYSQIISLLFHDKNIGLGANWASCVKFCKGKYIANCDNDDYWHNPNKLQLQVDFLEANSQYGVIHTDYRKHNRHSGKITEEKAANSIIENEKLQNSIMNGNFRCCNATVMYRKEVLLKYVNLDDYINQQFTLQDWNTWMILSRFTNFYCLHVSTATFGIETESITRPKSFQKLENRLLNERECYKYICNLFPEDFNYKAIDYDIYSNKVLLSLAYEKLDYVRAKSYYLKLLGFGDKSLRTRMASNWFIFHVFSLLKELKNLMKLK